MKKIVMALACGATVLALANPSFADTEKLEKTFSVESGGTLSLDSDSGSVDVVSHNQKTVDVVVYIKGPDAEDFDIKFEQDGNDVSVEGDRSGGWGSYRTNIRYEIKVPKEYDIDIRTGGGSIEIENLVGKVEAYTSGGSIKLGEITGDVDVKTSGGSIKVEEVAGNIDAHTSGGSIKAKLSKQPTEDCRLTTSGGSVRAYLASDIAVDLNASTSGGRVSTEFDINGTVKKNKIRGEINGGGPKLTLKTSGGSVSIDKL